MSLKDDPSVLRIPHDVVFPPTDYAHKRMMATMWVRRRHPDGPVAVYAKRLRGSDLRGFLAPSRPKRDPEKLRLIMEDRMWTGGAK